MYQGDDRFRKTLTGLFVVGLLFMTVVLWFLYDARATAWSQAVETSSDLVTALQRDIARTVQTYDLSLKSALRGLRAPELDQLSRETRQQLLFDGSTEAEHLGSLFIIDAAGHIVDDSGQIPPRQGSFDDRDYFTVHRDRADIGLYISKPYKSRVSGGWSIALSRRINGPGGRFDGIVVGSIRFTYFAQLFSKLGTGPGGAITLFNLDGTAIYRSPFLASQVGQDYSNDPVYREIHTGRSEPYEGKARIDNQSKLFAFAQVDGLPLVLFVSTATRVIYANWYVKAALTCLVSVMLAGFGTLLVLSARSQQFRRETAEREMVRNTQMLRAYFDHSPDALFVVQVAPDGRLTYESCNRACLILTGLEEEEVAGREAAELFGTEIAEAIEQRYRTCIQSGQTYAYEETRTLATGRRDWHAVLCPIRSADGTVTHLLGSARDMTEQNKREAAHHQASKMEAVGRLTAGVAHDFNNYLQTITGSLEVLSEDYLKDPEAIEYGDLARKAAGSGARLTHRLLAFSRQQVLRPQRVNVATLLGDTRKLVGSAGFGPTIQFKIAVEPFTDDVNVDPVQAESCLLNLLFNARDAMPEGGSLVLHARGARPSDGLCGKLMPENVVIIAVHDSGTGMDEATRARAFEPFFTTKAFGKGSGLGLSMAQGFCQQSGGEIRILSGGAVGTRIELWLPAVSAATAAGDEINSNLASLGRITGRILLVEDEHDVSLALAGALVSGGFEVVAVTNGRDGLARLGDRDPYDAVLTDYAMPDMTGSDFLARVAARAPALPMLMISGSDLDVATLPGGGEALTLLRKPIRRPDLLGALREAIAANKTALAA